MARPSYKHSFVKQFLEERDIQIYADGKQILKPIKKTLYKTYKLKTGFYVGETFSERKETQIIKDYMKIKNLGFCIVSIQVSNKNRTKNSQRAHYLLLRNGKGYDDVKIMPKNHYVEYDPYNRQGKIHGPNTGIYSPWVDAKADNKKRFRLSNIKLKPTDYRKYAEGVINRKKKDWYDRPEIPEFIRIGELPFMISDADEIVCIPQTGDEHTIGIFGIRRSGKTTMLHSMIDRMYWTPGWNKRFIILNDMQAECGSWCMPNSDRSQYLQLKKINQIPLPLPCVYIYPHVKDKFEMVNERECAFQMTMPYEEIINNFDKYMKLDKTAIYFKNMKDDLLDCHSMDDVDVLLERKKEEMKRVGQRLDSGVATKIRAHLESVFDDEITERNTGIPHEWVVRADGREYVYNPITACMVAGIVPVFETTTLSSYDFFQPYFRYFVEDVFNRQLEDPLFKKKNLAVYFFIDELHTVSSTELKGVADTILKRVTREGGPRRIGLVIADQNFSKINYQIRSNIKYIINFANPGEADLIEKTYKLGKHTRDEIKRLEKFECIACATDEEFVVYNRDGERSTSKGPIKGMSLPPLSQHKKPRKNN